MFIRSVLFHYISVVILLSVQGCAPAQKRAISTLKNPFELSNKKDLSSHDDQVSVLVDQECVLAQGQKKSTLITLDTSHSQGVWTQSFERLTPEQRQELVDHPCVQGIGDRRFAQTQAEDPMAATQSHLLSIQATESYQTFFDRDVGIHSNAIVAVIDTGLDLDHQDIRANLWMNTAEAFGTQGVDDDHNGFVDDIHGYNIASQKGDPSHETVNDHGTHVAGLVGAVKSNGVGGSGVMGKSAKIMAVNVFGKNWAASTEDIDNGIRYASLMGADVINISIGGSGVSDTTAAAMVDALNRGSIIVVSAGNTSQDISKEFFFPASYAARYPGLISVGASQVGNGEKCDFSNYGVGAVKILAPGCDLSAPREGLFSTRKGNQYGYKKGTSMASPLVTGAAALAWTFLKDRLIGREGIPLSLERFEKIFLEANPSSAQLTPWVSHGRILNLKSIAQEIDELYPRRK